ncbi:MAG: hypothetical protein WBA10_05165, partial [Elainellaceae cyanobacterium]
GEGSGDGGHLALSWRRGGFDDDGILSCDDGSAKPARTMGWRRYIAGGRAIASVKFVMSRIKMVNLTIYLQARPKVLPSF